LLLFWHVACRQYSMRLPAATLYGFMLTSLPLLLLLLLMCSQQARSAAQTQAQQQGQQAAPQQHG
jgi:hypothetical protein